MVSIEDIENAIAIPEFIKDKFIGGGTFYELPLGGFEKYSGGFSVVFPVKVSGEKWAFRCWHTPVENTRERLQILYRELKTMQLPYFCEFEYVDEGLLVDGSVMPTTRMRWIEGLNLVSYICKKRDKKVLQQLAKDFLQMCVDLHRHHIAHGDLQHGNIIVDDKGKLFLIDYDSVYLPAMGEQSDVIAGKQEYQHPNRKNNKRASERLDYFSELIIYIGILAISEDMSLIEKYNLEDGDSFLFNKEDFDDLRASQIYKEIRKLGGRFVKLLDILDDYLDNHDDINDLEPFMDILLEKNIKFTCSSKMLIRGKQEWVSLTWDVKTAADVCLRNLSTGEVISDKPQEMSRVRVLEDTTYVLDVKSADGINVSKELTIRVLDKVWMEFKADKYYSYPSIPVRLSWKVNHAEKVFLDNEEVASCGSKIVEPQRATRYTLAAKNELGRHEENLEINMLPIPQIKRLWVPVPEIEKSVSISVNPPQCNVDVRFPKISILNVSTDIPFVPSLTDLGLNVELKLPARHFSIKQLIKNIYKRIINKENGRKE